MALKKIENFLEAVTSRFKNKKSLFENRNDRVEKILRRYFPDGSFSFEIKNENVMLSSKNSALANEIFLKKEAILRYLREAMSQAKAPADIIFRRS